MSRACAARVSSGESGRIAIVGGEAFCQVCDWPSVERIEPSPCPSTKREGSCGSKASQQAGDVGGGGVDFDGAEIDEAGDFVAGEEDVVVPDVAQAGLQRQFIFASGSSWAMAGGMAWGSAATNWRASGARSGQVCR